MNPASVPVWQKITLTVGKIVLTLLLSWQLSQLVWQLVAPPPLLLAPPAAAEGNTSDSSRVAGTADFHLFGEASDEPVEVVQKPVDAPETRLRLTLMGVNQASVAQNSSAIIEVAGRGGEFFRMGETIQGRTKLAGVYPDKVILDTSGKLETLKFEDQPLRGSDVRAVQRQRTVPDNIDLPERLRRGTLSERFGKVRNAVEFVDLASDEISQDANAALDNMGLEPMGSGEGYLVRQGSPLMRFKLRPGDRVISLNGQPLGDPASDQGMLSDLQGAGEVSIEVQRGNSRFTVNHSLD